MEELRRRLERFFLKNRDKGIPNLMLYITIGNVAVYLLSVIDPSNVVYSALCFSRSAILHGQIWRLFSYIFTYLLDARGWYFFTALVSLLCYCQFGKILEQYWGRCKFNLYYLTGVVMLDLAALLFGMYATTTYLNISLFLAVATIAPEARVLLMFVLPIKMKWMAWVYLGFTALTVIGGFLSGPLGLTWLFPILALCNYFLFFGKDIRNIFPNSWQMRSARQPHARPNPNWAKGYQSKSGARPYRHKCTVCGRTDTEYPNLEFRYCSKCKGYYCYCIDHINNHVHIQ